MKNKKTALIFMVCYLAYTLIYIARLNLSVASPSFVEHAILDKAGIGLLGGVFSIVYASGRLINGYIADRQSPRRMIGIGLFIVGISNLLMGTLPGVVGLVCLWGCNAFAQSMLWGAVLRAVAFVYEPEVAKKKVSFMVTSVATGNIIGILLNTWLIELLGFRFAFVVPGILTFLFSGIVFFTLRGIAETAEQEEKGTKSIVSFSLFKIPILQRVLIPAFLHGVVKDNISVWMTVYFVEKFQVDLAQSAGFVFFIPLVGFVGRMLYPACYKVCGSNEHKVSVVSFAVCVLASLVLCTNFLTPALATVCLSLIYAAVSVANTSILSIFPLQFQESGSVASVSGIMDFATYLGAGVGSLIYGVVIKQFGYLPMFLSWAAVMIVSIFVLLRPALAKKHA